MPRGGFIHALNRELIYFRRDEAAQELSGHLRVRLRVFDSNRFAVHDRQRQKDLPRISPQSHGEKLATNFTKQAARSSSFSLAA